MKKLSGISILLVDDDKEALSLLKSLIEEEADNKIKINSIVCAEDGAEALIKFRNQQFDLLILDNDMPKKSGLEVLKFLKTHNLLKTTDVLFVSGMISSEVLAELREYPLLDIITKPYSLDRVIKHLAKFSIET